MSEETKCVFTVRPTNAYGKLPTHKCGKKAIQTDANGRTLCQHHYNRWVKKANKKKEGSK